jgi:hypothetical protein
MVSTADPPRLARLIKLSLFYNAGLMEHRLDSLWRAAELHMHHVASEPCPDLTHGYFRTTRHDMRIYLTRPLAMRLIQFDWSRQTLHSRPEFAMYATRPSLIPRSHCYQMFNFLRVCWVSPAADLRRQPLLPVQHQLQTRVRPVSKGIFLCLSAVDKHRYGRPQERFLRIIFDIFLHVIDQILEADVERSLVDQIVQDLAVFSRLQVAFGDRLPVAQ